MSKCPHCKSKLLTDHAFCPKCGADLRQKKASIHPKVIDASQPQETLVEKSVEPYAEQPQEVEIEEQPQPIPAVEEIPEITTAAPKSAGNYKIPLIVSVVFTAISIFTWCFVFTNGQFDLNIFMGKLVNNTFWIILVPWLISLPFKKEKRAGVYYNMVKVFVFIGCVLLLLGYSQKKATQMIDELSTDPDVVKTRLRPQCINSIIPKVAKFEITDQQKNEMATIYCDCILEKLSNDELVSIGAGTKLFWKIIEENYADDSAICVERQFGFLRK